MKIRILEERDEEDFVKLVKLADNRTSKWAKEKFKRYVGTKKKKLFLIIEEGGKLVGYAGLKGEDIDENVLSELNEEYALLTWIALLPEYRAKGLGSKLLRGCAKYSKKWKKKGLWTGCRDKVIPFYEKNGFSKKGKFVADSGNEENLMIKIF